MVFSDFKDTLWYAFQHVGSRGGMHTSAVYSTSYSRDTCELRRYPFLVLLLRTHLININDDFDRPTMAIGNVSCILPNYLALKCLIKRSSNTAMVKTRKGV